MHVWTQLPRQLFERFDAFSCGVAGSALVENVRDFFLDKSIIVSD